ncbi:DMT family transporter [Paraburkholderia acidicola]|uniref:DMT family transporter n=1 Tax=Paraburkholderia acidicola TaxID=1912599 RepID=A0ABV1LSY4_9BURK
MSDHRISNAAFAPATRHLLLPCAGLVLATLAWAGNAVIGRDLRHLYDPLQLTFYRWSMACICFYLINFKDIGAELKYVRRNISRLVMGGICGMAGYHLLQYYALARMPASEVAVIIGMTPVTVTVAEAFLRRAWPAPTVMLGIALGLVGVWLVCHGNGPAASRDALSWAGIAAAVAAMLCWSFYSMRVTRCEGLSPMTTMFCMAFVSSAVLLPFFLYDVAVGGTSVPTLRSGAQLLYLGIPASVVAYALYDRGIERVGRVTGAQFNCLIPAFASALAALFLGEAITERQIIGLFSVVIGLNVVVLRKSREMSNSRTLGRVEK